MNWLNSDLGSEELPDEVPEGTTSTLQSVVDSFVKNESGFSDGEVATYINRAITNEAVGIAVEWQHATELAVSYQTMAESGELLGNNRSPSGMEAYSSELMTSAREARERSFVELADVVARTVADGEITITAETLAEVKKLDDGVILDHSFRTETGKPFAQYEAGSKAPSAPSVRGTTGHLLSSPRGVRGIEVALYEAYGGRSLALRDKIESGTQHFETQEVAMLVGAFGSPRVEAREAREGRDAATTRVLDEASHIMREVSKVRSAQAESRQAHPSSSVDFGKGLREDVGFARQTEKQVNQEVAFEQARLERAAGPRSREPRHVSSTLNEYFAESGIELGDESDVPLDALDSEQEEILSEIQANADRAFIDEHLSDLDVPGGDSSDWDFER